jgi:hypothetical protein
MTPTIIVTTTPEGYVLKFKGMTKETFTPAIETLKRTVSPHLREYEPDTKQWFISDLARTQLDRWLGHLYVSYGVESEWIAPDDAGDARERPRKPHTPAKADAYAALCLTPEAPAELVKSAFKIMARVSHPDLGGSHEAMLKVNAAFKRLAA